MDIDRLFILIALCVQSESIPQSYLEGIVKR